MKKQMTELEVKEFLQAASTGHLTSLSVNAATLEGAKKRTFRIDMEAATIHYATWGTTAEGMAPPQKTD